MKLYVWENPYDVSYGHSMVFAVAENENEAREVAARGEAYCFGVVTGRAWVARLAGELGAPDRIVDLPAAEWHEWRE